MAGIRVIGQDGQALSDRDIVVQPLPLESFNDRIKPRQVATGVSRGQQTYLNSDGSKMVVGYLPDSNEIGIAYYDTSGNLVKKSVGPTDYVYNPDDDDHNVMQTGKLPEGYGWFVAKETYDVAEAYE